MLSILPIISVFVVHGLIDLKIIGKNQNEFIYISSNKPDDIGLDFFDMKDSHICHIPPVYDKYNPKNIIKYSAFSISNIKIEINGEQFTNKYLIINNKQSYIINNIILTLSQKASVSYFDNNIIMIFYIYKYTAMYKNNILIKIFDRYKNKEIEI